MNPSDPKSSFSSAIAAAWPDRSQFAAVVVLVALSFVLGGRFFSNLGPRPSELTIGPAIDLNRASVAELVQLPGIGPARAARIASRRQEADFESVDDLRKVGGVGHATIERVKPFVIPGTNRESNDTPESYPRKAALPLEPLDINSATLEQLQSLPGIGPKLAERIVRERTRRPFVTVEELRRVSGIGVKTLEKLRPCVTVTPSQASNAG